MVEGERCPKCGAELPADAPEGLCPKCLFGAALKRSGRPLHIRCPHCRHPVEIVDDSPLIEVTCPSCDSRFSLVGETTITGEPGRRRTIGRFELVEQIGRGAFGTVWRARDPELDRDVAVKIPRKEQLSPAETALFLREARAAAQLRHAHVVRVHEVGREGDRVYIVSDLVAGMTMADRLTAGRPTHRESAELLRKLADAIESAHKAGVIHRDLKPSNVLLDELGEPHLTDFGLAKRDAGEITMTFEGRLLGTPAYMSPEQARGDGHAADTRSDIYALGAMMFELLTGQTPFRGNTTTLLHHILHDEPPRLRTLDARVPRDLETITLKCIEKDPLRRYQSCRDLADDLGRWLVGAPIRARRTGLLERAMRWCRRNPVVAALNAAVVLSLLGGAIGSTYYAVQEASRAQEAGQARRGEREQRLRAERQARIADAERLAAESRAALAESPPRSLLLAVASVRATRDHGEPVQSTSEQALRDGLRQIGGSPLRVEGRIFRRFGLSPNGSWLIAGASPGGMVEGNGAVARLAPNGQFKGFIPIEDRWCHFDAHDRRLVALPRKPGQAARVFDLTSDHPLRDAWELSLQPGTRVLVSERGRWLVAEGPNQALMVFDLAESRSEHEPVLIEADAGRMSIRKFSDDDRWFVTVSRNLADERLLKEARLWDFSLDDPAASPIVLGGHEDEVVQIEFSRDGRWLATGTGLGAVQLWDLSGEEPRATKLTRDRPSPSRWRAPVPPDQPLFSPNSRWLVLGGLRETLVWDLASEDVVASQQSVNGTVLPECPFSPQSTWLVTGPRVVLYNLTSERLADARVSLSGHSAAGRRVRFSSDERWVCARDASGTPRLADLSGGTADPVEYVLRGHAERVGSVEMSPDGHWLVTASKDGPARLWDLTASDPSAASTILRGHEFSVAPLQFGARNRWLVTRGRLRAARLWRLPQPPAGSEGRRVPAPSELGASPHVLSGPEAWVRHVQIGSESRWAVTGHQAGYGFKSAVRIWDLRAEDPYDACHVLPDGAYGPLAVTSDGRLLARGEEPDLHSLRLWTLTEEGPGPSPLQLRGLSGVQLHSVAIGPRDRLVAAAYCGHLDSEDRRILVWDLESREPGRPALVLKGRPSYAHLLSFGASPRWLAASNDNTVMVWDLEAEDPNEPAIILTDSSGFDFSPDGRRLFAQGRDESPSRLVNLSDPASPPVSLLLEGGGTNGVPPAYLPDGRLATIDETGTIRLWQVQDEAPFGPLAVLGGGESGVSAFAVRGDGRMLAVGFQEGTIQLWQAMDDGFRDTPIVLRGHRSTVMDLAFSADGHWLVSGSGDGTARIWNLDVDELVALARDVAGRELNNEEQRTYGLRSVEK